MANYQRAQERVREIESELADLGEHNIWNDSETNAQIRELEYELKMAKRAAGFAAMRDTFGDEAVLEAITAS